MIGSGEPRSIHELVVPMIELMDSSGVSCESAGESGSMITGAAFLEENSLRFVEASEKAVERTESTLEWK